MPKKRSSSSSPILEKVSSFIKVSISLAKMKKPITLNLIFFKKSSRNTNKFKLLGHSKYGLIREYQFDTPLIFHLDRRLLEAKNKRNGRHFCSFSVIRSCFGGGFGAARQGSDDVYCYAVEALPAVGAAIENGAITSNEDELPLKTTELLKTVELGGAEDVCTSVDERAEQFIEKFYQQMRMQGKGTTSTLLLCD